MAKQPIIPLSSGSIIGIIGGGQLGRMTALAAAMLGYRCHIFCQHEESPASQVSAMRTIAPFTDLNALTDFANSVDVATFEFENIPYENIRHIANHVYVRPSCDCLRISQHRIIEKDFLNNINVPTAPYRKITNLNELEKAVDELGRPSILKTTRMGYDGKGQILINADSNIENVWEMMNSDEAVLEGFIDFEREISIVIARNVHGTTVAYVPAENRHKNHILDITVAPAKISQKLSERARLLAHHIAVEMNLVGLLAVEMFVTREGHLLVNELAPRPHNSGHWTMDACFTSQFEQLVRAICGLPLGSPQCHSDAEMVNLLGNKVENWHAILTDPTAKLYLYGKTEVRSGRKMGHVTRLQPKSNI